MSLNTSGFKKCSRCQETKPFGAFPMGGHPDKTKASGWKCYCKPCYVEHMRDYYARNPQKYRRLKERERERRAQRPAHMMWLKVRQRAIKTGTPFTITAADLEPVPTKCPVLGIPIEYAARGVNNPNAASVDRVDNAKGYEPGNVIIVSFRANELKRDATLSELKAIAAFYGARA